MLPPYKFNRWRMLIDNQTIKQALVVFDNFSSPQTIGDFFLVVMIARYFISMNIPVKLVIVDGEYRPDWAVLDETKKKKFIEDLMALGNRKEIDAPGYFLVERSQSLPNLSFSHSKGKIKIAGKDFPILKDIL